MPDHRLRRFAPALGLVLIVTACSPAPAAPTVAPTVAPAVATATPVPAEPTVAPTSAPTTPPATTAPTSPPPTVAPTGTATATPGTAVASHGVSFRYDPSLATSVTAQLVPTATEQSPAWEVMAQHLAFTFDGYPVQAQGPGPQIQEFNLDAYLQALPDPPRTFMQAAARSLRDVLAQKPDLNQKYRVTVAIGNNSIPPETFPPFIPPINAQPLLAAKKGYLDFQNGSGIRFVYWASQAVMYVDPNALFYTYEGLARDGKHIVAVTFPVRAPIPGAMPTLGPNIDLQQINAFNQDMAAKIEAADPAAFTPPLPKLDALVRSMTIAPDAP